MGVTFPNESPEYRAARNTLLQREAAVRREREAVASEIRALPPGPSLPHKRGLTIPLGRGILPVPPRRVGLSARATGRENLHR